MMLPTHALGGMALALPLVFVAPDAAGAALAGGFVGGVFPDLDMYAGHRRTLHYPVYYSVAAVPMFATALVVPSPGVAALAFALSAAAFHSVTDVGGGGLELRPWEASSDRAVYDHYRGEWIAPRRWVRYDGSPGDLLASISLAAPLAFVLEGVLFRAVVTTAFVAVVYATVRRRLPRIATLLVDAVLPRLLPPGALSLLPDRYLERDDDRSAA